MFLIEILNDVEDVEDPLSHDTDMLKEKSKKQPILESIQTRGSYRPLLIENKTFKN